MGSSVGFHPMLVIMLVLFGASIGGILGMLFAVPVAAILKVIIEELVTTFNKY
jgi:predicted PurR-regulated permease PerM